MSGLTDQNNNSNYDLNKHKTLDIWKHNILDVHEQIVLFDKKWQIVKNHYSRPG
jgi:hypothetical protein